MPVNDLVFLITTLAFHFADQFCIVIVMLPEYDKQRLVVHTHTEILVTYFLCRDIGVAVAYVLICLVHTHTDFVKHTVAFQSDVAPSSQTTRFHTPQFFLHVQLATELCYFPFTVIRHMTGISSFFFGVLRFR